MEELVDILKRAQCAVLHAQCELIRLCQMRDESNGGIAPSAGSVNNDALRLQLTAQSKQEDAVQHLEEGVRLMRKLLGDAIQQNPKDSAPDQETTQQRPTQNSEQGLKVNAMRQAMRRYIEGQRHLKQQWEWELHAKLTAKDDCIDEVRHNAADLVKRVTERRMLSRILQKWRMRTAFLLVGSERSTVAKELGRMRKAFARNYATARETAVMRLRCFHTWRLQMMRSLMRKERSKREEVSTKLYCAEEELRRQQDILMEALDTKRPEKELKVQRQQQEEILRLQSVVNGMVCEFKERTDTYIRQQEEQSQYYEERQAMLMEEVVIAEVRRQQQEQVLRCMALETKERNQWTETLCNVVADCVGEKALALFHEALAVATDSSQYATELEALLQRQRFEIIDPMKARVDELETRCMQAGVLLEGCNSELRERNAVVCNLKERLADRLLLDTSTQHMRGCWRLWQGRVEVVRQSQRLLNERATTQKQLMVAEEMCRQCLYKLEASALELILSKRSSSEAEALSEETVAELSETSALCTFLQEEVVRLKSCNAGLLDKQKVCTSAWFASELECLLEVEHARRMELRYSELHTRKALDRMKTNHHIGVMKHRCTSLQVQLDDSTKQLHHVGALVVEYCARSAFNCWLLSTERRRYRRNVNGTKLCSTFQSDTCLDDSARRTAGVPSKETSSIRLALARSGHGSVAEVLPRSERHLEPQKRTLRKEQPQYDALSEVASTATLVGTNSADEKLLMDETRLSLTSPVLISRGGSAVLRSVPLEDIVRYILAERDVIAEHSYNVTSAVWCAASALMNAQKCAHTAVAKELREYQTILERHIAGAETVDVEIPRRQQRQQELETSVRVKFLQEQWERSDSITKSLRLELQRLQEREEVEKKKQERIESLLASTRESKDRYEREVEVLQRRVGEQWEHNEHVKEKLGVAEQHLESLQVVLKEEKQRYERDVGELQRKINEYKLQGEKEHQKLREAQQQIESLLATLEEERHVHQVEVMQLEEQVEDQKLQEEKAQRAFDISSANQSREICELKAENARLSAQVEESERENKLNSALEDAVQRYGRALASLERDVADRMGVFAASIKTLADLDSFSAEVLSRYEKDVEKLFAITGAMKGDGGATSSEPPTPTLNEGEHNEEENLNISLDKTESHRRSDHDLQLKLNESQQQVQVLCSRLEEIGEQHKREVAELHQHIKEHRRREERIQKAAAAARANYEREMCVLRAEGKRLTAQVEELMTTTSTAEQTRQLEGLETQKQLEDAQSEAKGLRTELKTVLMHHAIECDRLHTTVEEQRHTIESLEKRLCGGHEGSAVYENAVCGLLRLLEEMTELVCEHMNEKSQIYLVYCVEELFQKECVEGETKYNRGTAELRECMELLLTTLGRVNAEYQRGKLDNERQMEVLQQLLQEQHERRGESEQEIKEGVGHDQAAECPLRSSPTAADGGLSPQPWLCCRCDSPLRREERKTDVVQSISRYSEMLQKQHGKNRNRLEQLNKLVARVDTLMEYSESLSLTKR